MTTDPRDLAAESDAFASADEADRTTRAVLAELGRATSPGEADAIAASLPADLAAELRHESPEPVAPPPLAEFKDRVAEAAGVDSELEPKVRLVAAAIRAAVGADELADARSQLPPEYDRLFEVGGLPVERSFVATVADRGDLDEATARALTEATLETLGDRLSEGEADDIATYLHGDPEGWMRPVTEPEAADFGVDEFVRRVADRAGVDEERASEGAAVVGDVLAAAVPARELERAAAQLPDEYRAVFEFPTPER